MASQTKQDTGAAGLLSELPVDRLREEMMELGKALAKRGVSKLGESLSGATDKLGEAVPGPGDLVKAAAAAPVKGAASKVKDAIPGMGSDDGSEESQGGKAPLGDNTNLKVTNIVETIDVPVSRDVAYQLWTQFEEFPSFMKKVETVKQKKPEEVTWKAQVFWSHRTWTAKIVDQVPPERIVWKSEADKGKVDGAVTFHELAPDLTRVLVSLEYHPQGLFERTGNLWHAQGRRVRLELKHFRRHVANHALIHQDDVEGWEGEIHEGKLKRRRSSNGSQAKKSSGGSTAKKSSSSGSGSSSSSGGSSSGGSTARKSTSGSTARKSASSGSGARKSTNGSAAKKASSSNRPTAKKSSSSRPATKKASPSSSAAKKSSSGGSGTQTRAAKKSAPQRTAAAAKTSPRRTTASTGSGKGSSGGSRSNARKSSQGARKTTRSSGTRSRS